MAELVAAAVPELPELLRPEQAAQKYEEAVAVAVEKCAADTAGQTCYICYGEGDEDEGLVRGCACRGGAGFAHVSCLARGAQVAVQRGVQNRWKRWHTCGLCKQKYHGVVACALGWSCWRKYLGRSECHNVRIWAMNQLGNGLHDARHDADALTVREAELAMKQRVGAPEGEVLVAKSNLASTYQLLGRVEEALELKRDVYSRRLELLGEEHEQTLRAAMNYALSLIDQQRPQEVKSLLRRTLPVARRVLGESHEIMLWMRQSYLVARHKDPAATLDDLREAATTLEETAPIARRVLGGAHPLASATEGALQSARAALRAREDAEPVSAQELDAAEAPPRRDQ